MQGPVDETTVYLAWSLPGSYRPDEWTQQAAAWTLTPAVASLLSPEELAGLACEEGVHSRLVIEKDAETPWLLRYGPFREDDFTALPRSHYSLLVSECEKWLPELQQLLDLFSFVPRWRIDDLMISYAPDQGSVGPHIDEYDVFLIQANGRRHWSISDQVMTSPAVIPDLDLAILQQFEAVGVGHHDVGQDDINFFDFKDSQGFFSGCRFKNGKIIQRPRTEFTDDFFVIDDKNGWSFLTLFGKCLVFHHKCQ